MQSLNLPPFSYQTREQDDTTYIFDVLRKKYLVLTPEEWVRQHFVHMLIDRYQYPRTMIRTETGLRYNRMARRSDILVFDRQGSPFLLVECKASSVKLSQEVFEQAARYNHVLKAPYLIITNGLSNYCCAIDHAQGTYRFLEDLPPYEPAASN
ncbi:Type I restriction enzyme R protein N terminus (HSDR_N) [Catalinimonas alkaloidigena]|uniref:Type I restriction enzyme R protein N terminus (HSDR_N) n=1 Tax=Catalinimonas alkaloidigena TaxID=1075417 RepID=A0A1G8WJ89_9BACT|nr:type I restriction enzyme HsdR N-terminal domain-containing protein [Catalinimonas alkaloidigena]SDJ78133.1 Type I restriction enzyme R protein N terminus (HSDR_N) [Catalinimonas alkaloidigena]